MNLSIIIPVYNSEGTLIPLAERLAKVLPGLAERFEVILVNDGSLDGSWGVILDLAKRFPWVRGIDLMRNSGQHSALLCGVREAQYEVCVTMDDDLQHPPEEIHLLLETLEKGFDVVYGIPKKLPHSWWRNLGSVLTKLIVALTIGIKTVRTVGPFRSFRTHLRKAFEKFDNPDVMLDVLLSWGTTRFTSVAVDEQPRQVGASNYTFGKLIRMSLLYLTNFSTIPLRFASIIGFFFTIMGLIGFAYVVAVYFIYGSAPGFPFLASAIMIFSGAQLFALGIIGEYLARVFERSSTHPPYTIARTSADPQE